MRFTNDFTTINEEVYESIVNELAESINATPVIICKCSNHPEDDYLYLYIAKKTNDDYVTGLANTSRNGYVGLYENHYNLTFKQALKILVDKIHDCNKGE